MNSDLMPQAMMFMLEKMPIIPGSSAFSATKRDVLLKDIQARHGSVVSIDAFHLHFVDVTDELSTSDDGTLRRLLDYGDNIRLAGSIAALEEQKNVVYVVPRAGSISPWSSKATDIAGICGLQGKVQRIERGVAYIVRLENDEPLTEAILESFTHLIHDRMTQAAQLHPPPPDMLFQHRDPAPLRTIDVSGDVDGAREKLESANTTLGLALSQDEIAYLLEAYVSGPAAMNRKPTDAELFMFAQVNSEHCRHKIFNASWTVDGISQDMSLFQMIRNTEKLNPLGTISAYSDNAAVLEGHAPAPRFAIGASGAYSATAEDLPILIKVETHNHPTAVSPFPGAATGSGGEIRDEGAVGRGSKPKAGLTGFSVSNLLIPGYEQPWEEDFGRPAHIASALDIMIDGPLGAAAFNNEFGRPALSGYFRTFSERVPAVQGTAEVRGYHKPIMIAGGLGNVRAEFAHKRNISPSAALVVLGGPGLLIGLGGGAASSQASGAGSAALDFASVQRENPEMQRRCQQVIDACVSFGSHSPVQSIHDVGAGGLSNALPELVHDSGLGATFEIRDVLVADKGMSPMEIWCNESQERYVLAIEPGRVEDFAAIANRERCPFSVVGTATAEENLVVTDRLLKEDVVRLKMSTLFGKPPKMSRTDHTRALELRSFDTTLEQYLPRGSLQERLVTAVSRVMRLPSVGSKSFLITIGDRSITGLVAREQMVGPWQVPVADAAVTRAAHGFDVKSGEAMAMGERTPTALVDAAASARMAVAEALLNIAAADVSSLDRIKLSANWMAAAGTSGEGAALYAAVQAIGMDLCPALGVGIPVGKDSMSMSMRWMQNGERREVTGPLSLIVTAFAPVADVGRSWTPQLRTRVGEPTVLVFLDLAHGKQRLGGSALAQVFREIGSEAPNVEDPAAIKALFSAFKQLRSEHLDLVMAYHDRSDGGLFTTIAEMCFAGRVGAEISLGSTYGVSPIAALFNEELGAVLQVRQSHLEDLAAVLVGHRFPSSSIHVIGTVNDDPADQAIRILRDGELIFGGTRPDLQAMWAETSFRMQALRDNPELAAQEYALVKDDAHAGLFYDLTFTPSSRLPASLTSRPKVAILREQGVNGHVEMAWSFTAAGFEAVDVHMSDVLAGRIELADFRGIAACGGFSYGDVLGAGRGWANSVLLHSGARKQFSAFFGREDAFALGVCNGCQFLSQMKELIPGAEHWPTFNVNASGRFEGRTCVLKIASDGGVARSVFLRDMAGSSMPVAVAHGEGRAVFSARDDMSAVESEGNLPLRYVDANGQPTEVYPLNPNGSSGGLAGIQAANGRVLALMPHPERVTMLEANSWYPPAEGAKWEGVGPWFQLFKSARTWCN
jgi:phosphoribosylformylglycinamidine synthase